MIQKHKTYSLMKTILNISIYIIGVITTMGATYAQGLDLSRDQNYMMAVRAQEPFATVNELETAPQEQKIYNITYYDGLGRPMQQTGINASPNSKDIITHIGYDGYGRQARHYLPYRDNLGVTGSYREVDVNQHINTYYKNKYADDFPGITDMNQINAYSESIFEPSPLNRVREQGAPGKAWKADPNSDTDHTIKFDWGTNVANEVVYFKVHFADPANTEAPSLEKVEFYNPGDLQVSITKDENWQPGQTHPNDHTTREYKDKLGRVVLKRTYNEGEEHDTYYVYDGYGNLTYVLPPKVTTTDGVSDTELSELCYQYRYDYRNRLIEKKIPGKGWEYIVYNKLDQPIMTQDANLRKEQTGRPGDEWLFTKYDTFGRVAYTGLAISSASRRVLQSRANLASSQPYETMVTTPTSIDQEPVYYTNNAYPVTSVYKLYTVNYYDDYRFLASEDAIFDTPTIVYNEPISNNTKSLPTGSKVRVLGTSYWTITATYYDKKARPIYTVSSNKEFLETTDIVATKLDFTGKVLETTTTHTKSLATIKTVDKFTYDHMGRLLTQAQKINNQAEEMIADNTYDELGQLQSKTVGGGLQDVNYTYNIRGWLRGINDVNLLGNDLFAFALDYNTGINPLYNGNISATSWQTANDHITRRYEYTYDALNRITTAESGTGRYNLSNVTYDKMGNILTLQRTGTIVETIDPTRLEHFGIMDNLGYTYDQGNKLLQVTDAGSKDHGFKDGVNTNDDFEYDANGNMIKDQNKGITSITYNHLNLPETVSISNSEGSGTISYIYDATGVKVKKIAPSGGSLIETEYTGGYVYKNGSLEYFSTSEGYVTPNGSSYRYVYQFKDHLDNVRLSYAKNDAGDLKIIEENNYYPFGLKQKGYNSIVSSLGNSTAQLLKFGGKELQDELGLAWYDITARNYDPTLGRWFVIDALADEPEQIFRSTYQYGWNNPVYYNDPDGNCPKCWSVLKSYVQGAVSQAQTRVDNLVNLVTNPIGTFNAAVDQAPTSLGEAVETAATNALENNPSGKVVLTAVSVVEGAMENGADGAAFAMGSELTGASIDATSSLAPGVGVASKLGNATKPLKKLGRSGKQSKLKSIVNDVKASAADKGWIKSEINQIKKGKRKNIRNPPGKDLAHERGREAAKGYGYEHSNLQDRDLHRRQHKYDNGGRKNKERPVKEK